MQELPPGFRVVGAPQGDPIIAPADPYKQSAEQRAQAGEARAQQDQSIQAATAALSNQLTALTIAEKQAKAEEAAKEREAASKGDEAARVKLMRFIAKLGNVGLDANDNGGWFETGASGDFARNVLPSGTAGYDLKSDINSLQAGLAFDALQAMRDASKTGGALGGVSERELELLQSAVGNIDPNQGHESFLSNLEGVRQAYLAKLAMIDPEAATRMGYNADAAEKSLLGLNDAYNRQFGTQQPIAVDRSPNGAPTAHPADIDAIMQKYGAR